MRDWRLHRDCDCWPVSEYGDALVLLNSSWLLLGWPDDQLLMPVPAVQRVVVHEVETQHELSWQDAATSTDRVIHNVGVQAGFPTLPEPVLLADPGPPAGRTPLVRPTGPSARAGCQLAALGISGHAGSLETIVAAACRAQQTLARRLLRQLTSGVSDGDPEDRRQNFLAAFALLEKTAERSVEPFD